MGWNIQKGAIGHLRPGPAEQDLHLRLGTRPRPQTGLASWTRSFQRVRKGWWLLGPGWLFPEWGVPVESSPAGCGQGWDRLPETLGTVPTIQQTPSPAHGPGQLVRATSAWPTRRLCRIWNIVGLLGENIIPQTHIPCGTQHLCRTSWKWGLPLQQGLKVGLPWTYGGS